MTALPGRPKGDSDTRARLIHAARCLFVAQPYTKVSTRLLASHAGTNAAMIRYYFVDKAGLFESMIKETFGPLLEQMRQILSQPGELKVAELFSRYYQVMGPHPDLPKLMLRSMLDPQSTENRLVARVFAEFMQGAIQLIGQSLQQPQHLQQGVDAQLARLSLIGLAVFPFIAPPQTLRSQGIELTPEFLTRLAQHNQRLVSQGIFKTASPES
jgi:AcrR family transcriptional regulator